MENPPPVAPPQSPTIQPQKPSQEPPVIKPPEEPKNKLIPLLVFLLLAALGVAGYFGWQNLQLQQQIKSQIVPSPQVNNQLSSPTPTTTDKKPYTENTNITNQKKYINPQLGISFLYLSIDPLDNTATFATKEVGNKVYVYNTKYSYESGQYVEVFNKNSDLTLKEAINKTFLENYSQDKCVVSTNESSNKYPSTYTLATIKVPGEFTDMLDMSERVKNCPKIYTQFGGSAFFLMDQQHPDKFVFFSIGQYGIFANEDNTMWEATIKFLD
jgi:cytoskeletal protein RodZ